MIVYQFHLIGRGHYDNDVARCSVCRFRNWMSRISWSIHCARHVMPVADPFAHPAVIAGRPVVLCAGGMRDWRNAYLGSIIPLGYTARPKPGGKS